MSFNIDFKSPNLPAFLIFCLFIGFMCIFTLNVKKVRSRLSMWLKTYIFYPDRMIINLVRAYPTGFKIVSVLFIKKGESTFKHGINEYQVDEAKAISGYTGKLIFYYAVGNSSALTLLEKGFINAQMFKEKITARNYHALFSGENEKKFMMMIIIIVVAFVGFLAYENFTRQQETNKWLEFVKNMTRRGY